MKKIEHLLANTSKCFPDRLALQQGDISINYKELDKYVSQMSDVLQSAGCIPGVSVGIILPNGIEYAIVFFAVSRAGGTIVPIDPGSTISEIESMIKQSDISIIICKKLVNEILEKILHGISISFDISQKGMQLENKFSGDVVINRDLEDVALLLTTSGSTGISKFVMLTDESLIFNIEAYKKTMRFEGLQKVYSVMPMHHIYHITAQLLPHISRGDEFYICKPPFQVKSFLKAINDYKITVTSFVPYMINLLDRFTNLSNYDCSSLEAITISGAKVPELVLKRVMKKFPMTRFLPTYGLTEAGSRVAIVRKDDMDFPVGSVGTALPGTRVKIDSISSDQIVGEILVKSKSVMKGYFKDSILTSQIIEDGWLRTGDLGFIEESAYIHIVGRKKNIILSGGMNINPAEIEDCLREHSGVSDLAVVPMRHELLQEVPCGIIESRTADDSILISDLKRICIKKLSLYKVPYKFICLKKIPRLSNTKIDYSKLKELINEHS